MVISSKLRMWQYEEDDHREHAPHFIKMFEIIENFPPGPGTLSRVSGIECLRVWRIFLAWERKFSEISKIFSLFFQQNMVTLGHFWTNWQSIDRIKKDINRH